MAGIYIHIPFCKQACNYCNFHFSTSLSQKEAMIAAIAKEIEISAHYLAGQPIETIYFGGGTPSLLQQQDFLIIWNQIQSSFKNIQLKEFTIEVNPDDINPHWLQSLKSLPINRFSIGIQSFHESDLQYMNRAHNAIEAENGIKMAQDAGFENLSIDLIYGTPGLTDNLWRENIEKAMELNIPHISSYALTVEPKTILDHQIQKGKSKPVDNEQSASQFELLMSLTQAAGFDHYEISNFGKPGHHAIHNTNYWKGIHYLGIGPSAHSFNGHSRAWNIANNSLYIKHILSGTPNTEIEILSIEDQLNEYIMTGLRTMWGIDLQIIAEKFGSKYAEKVRIDSKEFIQSGKMIQKNEQFILTASGKLLADGIAADLFF